VVGLIMATTQRELITVFFRQVLQRYIFISLLRRFADPGFDVVPRQNLVHLQNE
jgi:hypothetical protein